MKLFLKYLIRCFIIIISFNSWSQTIKTYSGEYELECIKYDRYSILCKDEDFLKGTATYTYYESDSGRVYSGSFKYTSKNVYGRVFTIQGAYKNGLKEGLWNFTLSADGVTYANDKGKASQSGTEKLSGNFTKGLRTGAWTYNKNMISNLTLINSYTKQVLSTSNQVEIVSCAANFKEGKFCGIFSYNSNLKLNGVNEKITTTGTFDNNCYMTAKWINTIGVDQVIEEFKDGINISYIHKNISTGVVVEKDDNQKERMLYEKYLTNRNTDSTGIKMCVHCLNYKRGTGGEMFSQWIYNSPGTSNDNQECIASNTMMMVPTLAERKAQEETELKKEEERNKKQKELKDYNACKTIGDFENFIVMHPNSQYASYAEQKVINSCTTISDLKLFITKYPNSEYKSSAQDKIYNLCETADELESFIFDYPDYYRMNEAKQRLNNLYIDSINQIVNKNNDLKKQVDDKYISYAYNPLSGKEDIIKYKKKSIYEGGDNIYKSYNNAYNKYVNNKDYKNAYIEQVKSNAVLKKLLELFDNENTKDLEKELKGIIDVDQLIKIFNL